MLNALIALEGDYYVVDEETGCAERAHVWDVSDELGLRCGAYAVKTASCPKNVFAGAVLISADLCEFLLECFGKVYLKWNYYDNKPFQAAKRGQMEAENERIRQAVVKTYGKYLTRAKAAASCAAAFAI